MLSSREVRYEQALFSLRIGPEGSAPGCSLAEASITPCATLRSMEVKSRQAALCILRRHNTFLVAEIRDPHTGLIYHRPPGGGLEPDESPEYAVRRELQEELGLKLNTVRTIGSIDHIWFWKGREVHERAWLFLADSLEYPSLSQGQTPEILEADGDRFTTQWRAINALEGSLPPICPATLLEFLQPHLT